MDRWARTWRARVHPSHRARAGVVVLLSGGRDSSWSPAPARARRRVRRRDARESARARTRARTTEERRARGKVRRRSVGRSSSRALGRRGVEGYCAHSVARWALNSSAREEGRRDVEDARESERERERERDVRDGDSRRVVRRCRRARARWRRGGGRRGGDGETE